jgi:hypothetical protein
MFEPLEARVARDLDFRQSWKRRRLRARAIRKALDLRNLKKGRWGSRDILLFSTLRNERERIDWFLAHYRRLGVNHFFFIDNDSDDGTREVLLEQPDASVWHTRASYKAARFGMDWVNALMLRYGTWHWCVVADADELLIYPHWETRPLPALTAWLEGEGQVVMPAMMLEMYPKGPVGDQLCPARGSDPLALLEWFDPANYMISHKPKLDALLIQGGPRARKFFERAPNRAPTLTKLPLIHWSWHNAWVNSTHSLLPRALNRVYARDGGEGISGALLHTKFLPTIVPKSASEKQRGEHFGNAQVFERYYDAVIGNPDLWCPHSARFEGWAQLEELGLISRGGWA